MSARKNPDQQAALAAIREARGMLVRGKDSFAKEWAEHKEAEIGMEEDKFRKSKSSS